jgi:cell division protein FtsZ
MSINGAMGVLVQFKIHPEFPMLDIYDAMNVVHESADEDADIIFGTTTDESLPIDYAKITIVATGFEHEDDKKANNETYENETKEAAPKVKIRPRLVVGGDIFIDDNELDTPAYIRRQQD